jgi:2-methylcitrate dehydratase PrpD
VSDPTEFLKETIPNLFNEGNAEVRAAADKGDAEAKKKREEALAAASFAIRVVLEGKAKKDLYVVSEKGELRTVESAPAGVPVLFAFALPEEAFDLALDDMKEDLDKALAKLRKRIPQLSPARARAGFERAAQEQLRFHFVMKDTPDFEEVRVKIAIGDKDPPEKPTFTVTLDYDVFEQLRSRKLKPQALVSKLQLAGDSSRAMQLIMQAVQRRGA